MSSSSRQNGVSELGERKERRTNSKKKKNSSCSSSSRIKKRSSSSRHSSRSSRNTTTSTTALTTRPLSWHDPLSWSEALARHSRCVAILVLGLFVVGVQLHDQDLEYHTIRAAVQHAEQAIRSPPPPPPKKVLVVDGLIERDTQPSILSYDNQKILEKAGAIKQKQVQSATAATLQAATIATDTKQDPLEFHKDENNQVQLVQGGGVKKKKTRNQDNTEIVVEEEQEDLNALNPLIPPSLRYLADLSSPYDKSMESPLFWHVAKSGGTSVKHMYSDCYQLVEACESGVTEGHQKDITLKVVQLGDGGWKFVNVDVTTEKGIGRASKFNVVASRKADMIVSPLLHEAGLKLFSNRNKGRFFTIFRDPLERVVSLFYYLQNATWEPTYNPQLAKMTFSQYVNSSLVESNFVARTLLDKMEAPLTDQDFEMAREILRSKCVVGLLDELEESVRRIDMFFGFHTTDGQCKQKYLREGTNRHSHPDLPSTNSLDYQELVRKNFMDIRLYDYAKQLFTEQASAFPEY